MTPQWPCAACGKPPSRRDRLIPDPESDGIVRVCSDLCRTTYKRGRRPVTDMDDNELEAMHHAGEVAGECLEHLGETDLAKLSVEEWEGLIATICASYATRLVEIADRQIKGARALKAKVAADDVPY